MLYITLESLNKGIRLDNSAFIHENEALIASVNLTFLIS